MKILGLLFMIASTIQLALLTIVSWWFCFIVVPLAFLVGYYGMSIVCLESTLRRSFRK